MLPNAQILDSIPADEVIAIGAAKQANVRTFCLYLLGVASQFFWSLP